MKRNDVTIPKPSDLIRHYESVTLKVNRARRDRSGQVQALERTQRRLMLDLLKMDIALKELGLAA